MIPSLYTALITPFNDRGIDYDGFLSNIQDQIKGQVKGIVLFGTTGEAPTINSEESIELLKLMKKCTDINWMVGTGSNDTHKVLKNILQAADYGASSTLIVTPYYNRPTQSGIYQHFRYIAEQSPLPIMLYNHPVRTGQHILPDTLKKLMQFSNIIGIKDSYGDLNYIQQVLHLVKTERPDFKVYSGDDVNTLPYYSMGASGLISVAANLIPQTMQRFISNLDKKDFVNALDSHQKLFSLFQGLALESNPTPVKTAMTMCGKPAGLMRLPLCEMERINKQKLYQILNQTTIIHGEIKPQPCEATV